MEINRYWAVEFNPLDGTVNIEAVDRVLRENRRRVCLGEVPERVLLGIYSTNEDAMKAGRQAVELLGAEIIFTLP